MDNQPSKIALLRQLFGKLGVRPSQFLLSIFLSLGAAFFEGLSIGLLVPLAKGLIESDFSFVKNVPVLKGVIPAFPHFSTHPNGITFIMLISIIFVGAVMKNIFQYGSSFYIFSQVEKFSSNLKKLIFDRYLSFGKLFFDRNNFGYLNDVLLGCTSRISELLVNFQNIMIHGFLLIVYLSIMFMTSWELTLLSLAVFPTLHYSSRWLIDKIRKTSRYEASAQIAQSSKISNILMCIPLVKSYVREEEEKKQFALLSDSVAALRFSMVKKQELVAPIQEVIALIALLLLISAMAFVVKNESRHIAGFLVFFLVLRRAIGTFGSLNRVRIFFARATGPIAELSKMLNDEDKFFVVGGSLKFTGLKRNIEFDHLNFFYVPEIAVLKDVHFSIERGKMTAIVGPTGSGKTTLIHLLLRFYDCGPNQIKIDGADIKNFTLESLRTHMALVSQDTLLFDDTLEANIAYGLDRKVSRQELEEVTRKARIYELIEKLPNGFGTLIGDRGVKLSGGEKQRVSIARAMLKGSEILLLDEATSALDSKTEKLIQEAIDQVVKGKTSVVIAHRLSTIKHADKIVVIENGRFIEEGALQELLAKKGKFYEYWEEQKFA